MTRWEALRKELEGVRAAAPAWSMNTLTRVVKQLADAGRCDASAPHWLQTRRGPGRTLVIDWKDKVTDALDNRGHPAVRLRGMSHLPDPAPVEAVVSPLWRRFGGAAVATSPTPHGLRAGAHLAAGPVLSLHVTLDKGERVRAYGVGIEGLRAHHDAASRWYARVDLTEAPEGMGDCGHPLLHCHIGSDTEHPFSPRVPVPWLLPHEALQWLLATVDPALEP